jgi:hypothetical protein
MRDASLHRVESIIIWMSRLFLSCIEGKRRGWHRSLGLIVFVKTTGDLSGFVTHSTLVSTNKPAGIEGSVVAPRKQLLTKFFHNTTRAGSLLCNHDQNHKIR